MNNFEISVLTSTVLCTYRYKEHRIHRTAGSGPNVFHVDIIYRSLGNVRNWSKKISVLLIIKLF